jgi:hypothetical protein
VKGHGAKQGRKDEEAIAALLAHPTVGAAAKAIGVGETTLWRWMKEPEFAARYREARQQVVDHAVGTLQAGTAKAVAALERMLDCDSPGAVVAAAKAIIDRALQPSEPGEKASTQARTTFTLVLGKRESQASTAEAEEPSE